MFGSLALERYAKYVFSGKTINSQSSSAPVATSENARIIELKATMVVMKTSVTELQQAVSILAANLNSLQDLLSKFSNGDPASNVDEIPVPTEHESLKRSPPERISMYMFNVLNLDFQSPKNLRFEDVHNQERNSHVRVNPLSNALASSSATMGTRLVTCKPKRKWSEVEVRALERGYATLKRLQT